MKILGIETSCDDTGVAVVEDNKILFNKTIRQHHKYGVIPEAASRAHYAAIVELLKEVVKEFKIDLIAYTNGPGLIGSLFVGASIAKGLAYSLKIPAFAVHHLQAHVLLPYWLLTKVEGKEIEFPFIGVVISGGHTIVCLIKSLDYYEIIASTIDDAIGEVFDKVARYAKLPYPGGPEIEKQAKLSTKKIRLNLPYSLTNGDDYSFSGIKTAAIRAFDKNSHEALPDYCNAFQAHMANVLHKKLSISVKRFFVDDLIISGGVAANEVIRNKINTIKGLNIYFPPIELCGDNGVMTAVTAQLLTDIYGTTPFHFPINLRYHPRALEDLEAEEEN